MPADKLTLLCPSVRKRFEKWALDDGKPKGGYAKVIDLNKSGKGLPVRLHWRGNHTGIHKIDFMSVAQLGLSRVTQITEEIFGDPQRVRIFRVDWCVDLLGIPVEDIGLHCRIASAQNCTFIRSRSGVTFYLRHSKQHIVLVYDRLRLMRARGNLAARIYGDDDQLTRIEVQFRGGGVPFRSFQDLRRYAKIDLIPKLTFWNVGMKRAGLRPMQSLAAEGLLNRIDQVGIQAASKMLSAQEWAYLSKVLLEPQPGKDRPDLNELMRKSARDWLNDRIRFPRGKGWKFRVDKRN